MGSLSIPSAFMAHGKQECVLFGFSALVRRVIVFPLSAFVSHACGLWFLGFKTREILISTMRRDALLKDYASVRCATRESILNPIPSIFLQSLRLLFFLIAQASTYAVIY